MAPQVEHYEYEMKLVEQDIDKTEKLLHNLIYKCDAIHRVCISVLLTFLHSYILTFEDIQNVVALAVVV